MTRIHRFNRLPHPKAWLPISVFSVVLTLVAGLVGTNPAFLTNEFAINKALNSAGGLIPNVVAGFMGDMYSPKMAIILTFVTMVLIWLVGKSSLDAFGFGATVAFGWLPAEAFKIMFNEPRADITALVNKVSPQEVDASFPSGHVCFALAFGFALWFLARNSRMALPAAIFWAVTVVLEAWARLYEGAHYLSDELGSVFTTTVGILLFAYIWNKWLSQKLQSYKFFA